MLVANEAGLDRDEAFELYVLLELEDRINTGLGAFRFARSSLYFAFDFTIDLRKELCQKPEKSANPFV